MSSEPVGNRQIRTALNDYSLFTIYHLLLFVFRRVEPQDFLALAGARVNGAQVPAPLHLPDGRDLPILLDCVVGYLFGGRGLLCLRRCRRVARLPRALRRRAARGLLVLCHVRSSPNYSQIFLSLVCDEDCNKAKGKRQKAKEEDGVALVFLFCLLPFY